MSEPTRPEVATKDAPGEVYDVLRRVNYGGRLLWAAALQGQTLEGTGATREAALLDLVHQLGAERPRPRVSVNVNLVVDVEALDLAKIDHVFRGLAKLQEAGADVQ